MITFYPNQSGEIDGSPIVEFQQQGDLGSLIITEDGRKWYWEDTSWRVEPGTPFIPDGHWVEYGA